MQSYSKTLVINQVNRNYFLLALWWELIFL